MSAFIDASAMLAEMTWYARAHAYGLQVREWEELTMHERRIYVQQAQDTLAALRPYDALTDVLQTLKEQRS